MPMPDRPWLPAVVSQALRGLLLILVLPGAATVSAAPATPDASEATAVPTDTAAQIAEIARLWAGDFDNGRQVDANLARGEPAAPELTRERRTMQVRRIDNPRIGATVLFYEEFRATQPGRAHRQRVVSLVFDPGTQRIRAEQWFFRTGPAYDRAPLDAAGVAQLGREAFTHQAGCDLYFDYESTWKRWRGGMLPRACVYEHEVDGTVYADFEMLLYPSQLWYRDRSVRLSNGTVRGEVDGFSWLLFDRAAAAASSDAR